MSFLEGPWNTFLVHPLMAIALIAYSLVRDFGFAIILVTFAIRFALYPLFVAQIRSQRVMQELGPALNELRAKYGKDRQRFAEEQMKLYRERGVNPAAGCLPLVLQLPILFALYSALLQLGCGFGGSQTACPGLTQDEAQVILGPLTQLVGNPVPDGGTLAQIVHPDWLDLGRSAISDIRLPFTLDTVARWLPWLTEGLQHRDPFLILPILAGALQLIASVMAMPAKQVQSTDPNQRMFQSMAYTFPLMTVVIGASFPAGLTLYWIATTLFQIVQQYFVSGWGQLPRWLPFLRGIPSPADAKMRRETADIVREGRADLERRSASAPRSNGEAASYEGEEREVASAGRSQRRRGRRRGRR